jgi:hypothetical protein
MTVAIIFAARDQHFAVVQPRRRMNQSRVVQAARDFESTRHGVEDLGTRQRTCAEASGHQDLAGQGSAVEQGSAMESACPVWNTRATFMLPGSASSHSIFSPLVRAPIARAIMPTPLSDEPPAVHYRRSQLCSVALAEAVHAPLEGPSTEQRTNGSLDSLLDRRRFEQPISSA